MHAEQGCARRPGRWSQMEGTPRSGSGGARTLSIQNRNQALPFKPGAVGLPGDCTAFVVQELNSVGAALRQDGVDQTAYAGRNVEWRVIATHRRAYPPR